MKEKRKYRDQRLGYLFILPLLIYFIIFQLTPMVVSLFVSMTEWNLINDPTFVGFDNYYDLFTNTLRYPDFWKSLWVTFKYILFTVPTSIFLALVVSALLNSDVKGESMFKTVFYLPSVTAGAAIAALWTFMLDPQYGLINQVLGTNIAFLSNEKTALPTLAVMAVWSGLGYNVLITLSAMKSINPELYEAAALDGAGAFGQFKNITIPSVKPIILFLTITSMIGGFQAFDQMYLMTGGGPNKSTMTYMLLVYKQANEYNNMGIASAMSYILFFIILIITFLQFRITKEKKVVIQDE